jgi:CxxC motif-containing protein (DUF1111 family)
MPGLSPEDRRAFVVGNSFFRDNWVVAPAAPEGRAGLGPLFNANSCSACHPDDGRGAPTTRAQDAGHGMVVFVSPAAADGDATGASPAPDAAGPHPLYGVQLQDQAIPGVVPEARVWLAPRTERGQFSDGTSFELRAWTPQVESPADGPLGPVALSVRIGPQLVGGGLLEAVPDATLVALADPSDRDGDGISGRAHRTCDGRIGRFGWKASQPTIEDQVQAALHEDIGITSPKFPQESATPAQRTRVAAGGGAPPTIEADAHKVQRLAHYCRVLAVPAQRDSLDPQVQRGRAIFESLGCARCHAPTLATGDASPIAALRQAEFHPYTDLLLHDLGPGLADGRRDGDATGREWRTAPLWGIGLVQLANEQAGFLHDGRARTLQEAILWHGGEAERAREAFRRADAADRAALLRFLQSL